MSSTSGQLVRKLRAVERFYETCNSLDFLITTYQLTLKSKKPLKVDEVRTSLHHLFRNIPVFNLCIKGEGEEMAFYNMTEEKIEFEEIKNEDANKILHTMTHKGFDSKSGPLWRCTLLVDESKRNEIQDDFQSTVFFAFHHSIIDGFTCFKICNHFLDNLNRIISGLAVNDNVLAEFGDGTDTDIMLRFRKNVYHEYPDLLEKVQKSMLEFSENRTFINQMCEPNIQENCTKHLTKDLDIGNTKKLIALFKTQKVSFHSGFCALAGWALVDLLKTSGVVQDSYSIGTYNAVDLRRFWDNANPDAMGCHVGSLRLTFDTPSNLDDREVFWKYAQAIQRQIKVNLRNHRWTDEALEFKIHSATGSTDAMEMLNDPEPPQCYYSTTNMGDVKKICRGTGKQVEIDWMTRSTSIHRLNATFIHIFQTFRGRFLYGLDYVTKYVSDDLAQQYMEKIFEKIHIVLETQN